MFNIDYYEKYFVWCFTLHYMDDRLINVFFSEIDTNIVFIKNINIKITFVVVNVARGIIPFDLKNCNVGFVSLELRNAIFPINLYKEKDYNLNKSI